RVLTIRIVKEQMSRYCRMVRDIDSRRSRNGSIVHGQGHRRGRRRGIGLATMKASWGAMPGFVGTAKPGRTQFGGRRRTHGDYSTWADCSQSGARILGIRIIEARRGMGARGGL